MINISSVSNTGTQATLNTKFLLNLPQNYPSWPSSASSIILDPLQNDLFVMFVFVTTLQDPLQKDLFVIFVILPILQDPLHNDLVTMAERFSRSAEREEVSQDTKNWDRNFIIELRNFG